MLFGKFSKTLVKIAQSSIQTKSNLSSSTRNMGTLYKHQSSLPKLPVPTLAETLERYYQSCLPHFKSEDEAKATRKAITDFEHSSYGQELQSRLVKRAETSKSSWLIDWWNDYAYMSYRDPVVINVSYFFVFRDDKLNSSPAARAATITKGALKFRQMVADESLEPETTRSGPLCSEQYKYLFNSTRVPAKPSDVTRVVPFAENNFIVVTRKNKFFKVDTHDSNGVEYSAVQLQAQFERVIALAGDSKDVPVGLLTAENRDVWSDARDELISSSPINKTSLDIIERASFVVCLDDTSPVTREECSRACWHGDGRNRFFDKSFQFIIFENGKAGFLGEHSMMDATPTSRLCDFILSGLAEKSIQLGDSSSLSSLKLPEKLSFHLTANLETRIEKAGQTLDEAIRKHDVKVVVCESYGKSRVKKMGLSPDSYAQMAIQLAYFKLYGHLPAMYESAQTRKYAYGRTETCRSVTTASVEWVKAMANPHLSLTERGALGRKAIASQVAYMANAVEGRGVDRHLLGLRLLMPPTESKPSLFTDPLFSRTCHWKLSTSQITSEYYDGYGWGEVVPDGYGIAYMIKENSFHFNVCSLFLQNHHFGTHLHEALAEMKEIFEATIPPRSKI